MRKSFSLLVAFAVAVVVVGVGAGQGRAEGESTPGPSSPEKAKKKKRKLKKPAYYAALGEGQTLPAGVLRVRLPFQYVSGNYGYDNEGHREDLGAKVAATGTAFVMEYGATSRLSLQLLAPYVLSNNVSLDASKFAQSPVYASGYNAFVNGVATKLQAQGLCPTVAACGQLIATGYSLPADTPITLPSGEILTMRAGVPVKDYANALVVGAARPVPGATGLGDIEIGALFMAWRTFNADFAVGAGFRLPTGSFSDVPSAQVPTGRGTTDLGLRLNFDYSPYRGVWLSYQNQSETMVLKGRERRTSLLDDSQLDSVESGYQTFERRGVRNVGFAKVGWGLGNIDQVLAPIGTLAEFKYNFEEETFLDGVSTGPAATGMSVLVGGLWDGLAYRLPLQVEYDYEVPVAGKNETIAQTIQLLTLKGYYKF
jgi:hypothetical protein